MNEYNALRLRAGRMLGYATYGDPDGVPVFFFHGFPGSRLEGRLLHRAAERVGVRLISLDRPGFGLSDFKPHRTFLGWPHDVCELAADLDIEQFAVMGVSGGGPYALACAYMMPERLTGVSVVGGIGPLDAPESTFGMTASSRLLFTVGGKYLPGLVGVAMAQIAKTAHDHPERILGQIRRGLCQADKDALDLIGVNVVDNLREAFVQGTYPALYELSLLVRYWDFPLDTIEPEVQLWHGVHDHSAPVSMAHHMASALPHTRNQIYRTEGHYAVLVNHIDEILATLIASEPASAAA